MRIDAIDAYVDLERLHPSGKPVSPKRDEIPQFISTRTLLPGVLYYLNGLRKRDFGMY